ncbi:VOC family protein [Sphingobium sufflavum]|uniref:VOC family protein n=1 Tax=Sphingobium sufflavum TaxID=1129547 RepID=UPI001F345C3E|nr:VOC family protein [Sphingobium sufflavum]MCE7798894.1 VOC family protein [Sphingobium sufflavum]
MVLMSVRLGTNDAARASRFYDAVFAALGLHDIRVPMGPTVLLYSLSDGLHFMLASPRDGQPATHGNGDTLGFTAADAATVDRWHAAGLAHGGICDGAPGVREAAGGRYGAYLRDPDGHKLCVYAVV